MYNLLELKTTATATLKLILHPPTLSHQPNRSTAFCAIRGPKDEFAMGVEMWVLDGII